MLVRSDDTFMCLVMACLHCMCFEYDGYKCLFLVEAITQREEESSGQGILVLIWLHSKQKVPP